MGAAGLCGYGMFGKRTFPWNEKLFFRIKIFCDLFYSGRLYTVVSIMNANLLKTEDKVVTAGVLLLGLLLFLFLLPECRSKLAFFSTEKSEAEERNLSAEIQTLLNEKEQAQERFAALEEENIGLRFSLEGQEAEFQTLQESLKAQESKKAHAPTVRSLSTEGKVEAPLAAAPSVGNTEEMEAQLKRLSEENAVLNEKWGAQVADVERLKASLEEMGGKHTESYAVAEKNWKAQIESTREQLDTRFESALEAQKKTFQSKVNLLKDENARLRAALQKQTRQQGPALVKSSDDLGSQAKALYARLKEVKGSQNEELVQIYEKINSDLGATSQLRIKFSTGQSEVNADDQARIKVLISQAQEDSLFLAVGYADQSGNASANRALSETRAAKVAKALQGSLENGDVQAVYLGETDRFGAPAENRVVEIWEIKK